MREADSRIKSFTEKVRAKYRITQAILFGSRQEETIWPTVTMTSF
jgi:hypothetical protein